MQQKIYNGELYNIKLKYHPNKIICTGEHPFYVREKVKKWNNAIRRYEYSYSNPKWKKANELTKLDYFGMVINNNEIIPEFIFEQVINQTSKKTIVTKIDTNDKWFLLGYFIGDGWIEETTKKSGNTMNKIRFAINNNDENEVVDRINKILQITDKKCNTGKCKKFGCSDFVWYNILKQCGKYAHNKIIPEWIQDAPKDCIREFINGYMKSDGCINKGNILQITTTSHNLALGLQRLYLKLGHIFSINKQIRPKKTIIQGRIVNQKNTYCIRAKLLKEKESGFIENNYAWFKSFDISITKTEKINVYNYEVKNDNSYIVENTIVHNCQPFSIAGKQKGFDDPRSNVFWKIIEIVKKHKPECIILENVKNLSSHDCGDTLKTIIKSLEDEKYKLIYKILNTSDITTVPQHRERLYIVCVKDTKIFETFNFDFPKLKKDNVKKMLTSDQIDDKYYYNDKTSKIQKMVMDNVTNDETIYQFRRIFVRENKNNECPTLTANMGTGGHNVPLVLDNLGARKLTPRECFNFQGFPSDFILPKLSDARLYKLAGNAVSVPVVQLIANKLVPELFNNLIK